MEIINKHGVNLLEYLPTGWVFVPDVYKWVTVDSKGWVVAHKEQPIDGISDSCYALHYQDKEGGNKHYWKREGVLYSLAETIRTIREHKGWTQKQMAEKIGVTQSYLAQVETKDQKLGSLRLARLVSQAAEIGLNISIKDEKVVFSLQPYH